MRATTLTFPTAETPHELLDAVSLSDLPAGVTRATFRDVSGLPQRIVLSDANGDHLLGLHRPFGGRPRRLIIEWDKWRAQGTA